MKLIQLDFTFSNIQDITPPTTTKKKRLSIRQPLF